MTGANDSTTTVQEEAARAAEETAAAVRALVRRSRAVNGLMAMLSLRAIAACVRAVLPAAATVGLRWSEHGLFLEQAGYFGQQGQCLDLDDEGAPLGDQEFRASVGQLTERISVFCRNLNEANVHVWSQLTSDAAAFGTILDGEYRLDIGKTLASAEPARACSCPVGSHAITSGVTVAGHKAGCPDGREPRLYVWHEGIELSTGTLADYGQAFEIAHDDSLPTGDISEEIRTWDADFPVQAWCLDDKPDRDGCWPVRLSVPGEQVTVHIWSCSQPFPPADATTRTETMR